RPPVRRLVAGPARRAGLAGERAVALVLAANEIAANTISHTAGSGVLQVWHTPEEIVCQVHDRGEITDPLAGRIRRGPDDRGHGLWLANPVCGPVALRPRPAGPPVRDPMRRAGSPGPATPAPTVPCLLPPARPAPPGSSAVAGRRTCGTRAARCGVVLCPRCCPATTTPGPAAAPGSTSRFPRRPNLRHLRPSS